MLHEGDHSLRRTGHAAALPVRITVLYQTQALGIADALLAAERYLEGDAFILLLGDNLSTRQISMLQEMCCWVMIPSLPFRLLKEVDSCGVVSIGPSFSFSRYRGADDANHVEELYRRS
jgi:hypothetical protein